MSAVMQGETERLMYKGIAVSPGVVVGVESVDEPPPHPEAHARAVVATMAERTAAKPERCIEEEGATSAPPEDPGNSANPRVPT